LLEIKRLLDAYGSIVRRRGFSAHYNGTTIDNVAFTLGAEVIERHFTLDRTWKGTDHAASLEPSGLFITRKKLDAALASLTYKSEEILPIEKVQRDKLKYRNIDEAKNDERPWGLYSVIEQRKDYKVKHISVYPKHRTSLQQHKLRSETWTVLNGVATATIDDIVTIINPGETITVRAMQKHRLMNDGDVMLEMIEIAQGEKVDESDIVRFEDDYGRLTV
jgi:mannose-6-phosphate isomerase-like protein (cupin superfamily)